MRKLKPGQGCRPDQGFGARVEELVFSPGTVCLQAAFRKSQREWVHDHINNQRLHDTADHAEEMLKI